MHFTIETNDWIARQFNDVEKQLAEACSIASPLVVGLYYGWLNWNTVHMPLKTQLRFDIRHRYNTPEAKCSVALSERIGKMIVAERLTHSPSDEKLLELLNDGDKSSVDGLVLAILLKQAPQAGQKQIIALFRARERATENLIRKNFIVQSIRNVADALFERGMLSDHEIRSLCYKSVPYGAEKKALATLPSDWIRGFYDYPMRLKENDVQLTESGQCAYLRLFHSGKADEDDISPNDVQTFALGEVREWLREQGIQPLRVPQRVSRRRPRRWLIRIEDVPKRVLFKLRFGI